MIHTWTDGFYNYPRPVVAIRGDTHGSYLAQSCPYQNSPYTEDAGELPQPDPFTFSACIHSGWGLLIYRPELGPGGATPLDVHTSSGVYQYRLVHLADSPLWQLRTWYGYLFGGAVIDIGGGQSGYELFHSYNDATGNDANPPWQWQGGPGNCQYELGRGGCWYKFTYDATNTFNPNSGQWPTLPYGALFTNPAYAARTYFPGYGGKFIDATMYNAYAPVSPPCCQALGVSIDGPDVLNTGSSGTWSANASGGTGPYTYSWRGPFTSTASAVSGALYADADLFLDVWDAAGAHVAVTKHVTVTGCSGGNLC